MWPQFSEKPRRHRRGTIKLSGSPLYYVPEITRVLVGSLKYSVRCQRLLSSSQSLKWKKRRTKNTKQTIKDFPKSAKYFFHFCFRLLERMQMRRLLSSVRGLHFKESNQFQQFRCQRLHFLPNVCPQFRLINSLLPFRDVACRDHKLCQSSTAGALSLSLSLCAKTL